MEKQNIKKMESVQKIPENKKTKVSKWSLKPKRNEHLLQVRDAAKGSKTYLHYAYKKRFNIMLWSLILIEPVANVITFMTIFLVQYLSKDPIQFQMLVGFIGMWVSIGILVIYLSAYIPIITGMKLFAWEHNGEIIVIYVGILKVHLAIDDYIWDNKPKRWSATLIGKLVDGSRLEARRREGAWTLRITKFPASTPVI